MGRKLDLSGLTDDEAEHVLKVVQRDMKLRKKEEERLSEMKQELDEEGSRCSILSKQNKFNEHCCIRCCSPFTFLLNPKRQCLDCQFYVCKGCRIYCKKDKAWLCSACEKSRVLRTQSLEWYYNNVKSRFKRFGSAKVLKTLYRKHIAERGALSEFTEGSFHEGSIDNEGSVCGSDSTFYRQSEGHSMADTLTVALRVAEEAIEEAIAKAEEYSDSLEKQNEARYLRDNKEELIEELATTIVQKIIQRRKRSEMQAEYEMVWPATQNQNQSSEPPSPTPPQPSPHTVQASLKTSYSLWRSRSAFSLTSDDSPEKPTEPGEKAGGPEAAGKGGVKEYASLKKEARAAQMTSWKSVDRLDNSCASSVLQSPDGNWIALQSTQLSRPSLLTKRKSLVFSVLEKESGVVSAYDEMGSDTEDEDPGGWVSALHQFRRKMSDETYYTDSQHDPEWTYTQNPAVTSPSSGQYTNTETLNSDSEPSPVPSSARDGPPKHRKHLLSVLKRKGGPDHHHHHLHHPHPHQLDALDINFNPKVAGGPGGGTGPEDSSEAEDRHSDHIRRSRRRRKSKREQAEPGRSLQPQYSSSVPEYSSFSLSSMARRELEAGLPPPPPDTVTPDTLTSEAVTPSAGSQGAETAGSRAFCAPEALELELKSKLRELVRRASDQELTSSEDDSPQRAGDRRAEGQGETPSEGERESACDQEADRHAKREEERLKEKSLERAGERLGKKEGDRGEEGIVEEEEEVLGEMLQKEEVQREEEGERDSEVTLGQAEQEAEGTGATHPVPKSAPYVQEEILSADDVRKKYSAASLCSITTEVLKVLNATEELIEGAGGEGSAPPEPADPSPLPSGSSSKKLDEHLTKLEENVYLAAGTVYGLEGELGDLEECARAISSGTTEKELAYLEDQVASAAAQVQQSELQISDIEARISALKTAGLNVTACTRFSKFKPKPKPETIGSSRQQRRKLPAPPLKGVTR